MSSEWGFPEGKLGRSRDKEGGVKDDGCMMEVVGDGNVVVFTYLILYFDTTVMPSSLRSMILFGLKKRPLKMLIATL